MARNSGRGAARLGGLLLLAGAVAGCGNRSAATVSGTVSYKGKPVTSGEVVFLCQDGKATIRAPINADGTYTARDVPAGPAKLGVDNPRPAGGSEEAPTEAAPTNDPEVQEIKSRAAHYVATPPRYADPNQAGLSYTITPGSQKHDITLP